MSRPTRWGSRALPRTLRLTARHWEALDLLARAIGATPSEVIAALVEQATAEAAQAVEEMELMDATGVADQDAER